MEDKHFLHLLFINRHCVCVLAIMFCRFVLGQCIATTHLSSGQQHEFHSQITGTTITINAWPM